MSARGSLPGVRGLRPLGLILRLPSFLDKIPQFGVVSSRPTYFVFEAFTAFSISEEHNFGRLNLDTFNHRQLRP